MVLIIAGASHTGKTVLAKRLIDRYGYPCFSIDHLKMGLIRAGITTLTPNDDGALTLYLWPVVREMIKTAIENEQNLIVEGLYVPYDWEKDFAPQYLANIRCKFLVMSENYIKTHFADIAAHACDVEKRVCDNYSITQALSDNAEVYRGCVENGADYIMIDGAYDTDNAFLSGI